MSARRSSSGVFTLLEMLEVMPGVLQEHVLPCLQGKHKAALAASCSALRHLVQPGVTALQLTAGTCCLVHTDRLAPKMPDVASLYLKPGNLHEAMYVLPIFFMQDARYMHNITFLQLHDLLPDRPPLRVQCGSCQAWTCTYDLAAVLATAGMCLPHLAALDFSTHYVSDAECAAVARMTGLTQLTLRSTHGTKPGGLARMSPLTRLADLRLFDSNHRHDDADVDMLLTRSHLTHLQLGYYLTFTAALLARLRDLQQKERHAEESVGAAYTAAANMGNSTATTRMPNNAAHGPPLQSLKLVLSPYVPDGRRVIKAACSLSNLVELSIGWLRPEHEWQPDNVDEWAFLGQQKEFSKLVSLKRLALGWSPRLQVLAGLSSLTGLSELQMGGLPRQSSAGAILHSLPAIKRLTCHVSSPFHGVPVWPPPPGTHSWTPSLMVFPALTSLELTGVIDGDALRQLPKVASHLVELLLPERLTGATYGAIAALQRLTALTCLRVGWRAATHQGPTTLGEEWDDGDVTDDDMNNLEDVDVEGGLEGVVLAGAAAEMAAAAAAGNGLPGAQQPPVQQQQQQQQQEVEVAVVPGQQPLLAQFVPSLAALMPMQTILAAQQFAGRHSTGSVAETTHGAAYNSATGPPAGHPIAAGAGRAGRAGSAPAPVDDGAAAAAAASMQQACCSVCSATASFGCLCRLAALELVGPVPGYELLLLTGLKGLRSLVLRDNTSWSSGLPCTDLAHVALGCSTLTRLEVIGCPGVDGIQLEAALCSISPEAFARCELIVQSRGRSAAELGKGYQYMGCVLAAADERGDDEQVLQRAAAAAGAAHQDEDPSDSFVGIGPLPEPIPHLPIAADGMPPYGALVAGQHLQGQQQPSIEQQLRLLQQQMQQINVLMGQFALVNQLSPQMQQLLVQATQGQASFMAQVTQMQLELLQQQQQQQAPEPGQQDQQQL